MSRHLLQLVFLGCAALGVWPQASAHSGGLNKDGCHNDRKNGGYHCHRGSGSAGQSANFVPPSRNSSAVERSSSYAPAGSAVYFRNCDEARAAGVAPIRRGQPGYATHLDRDGDGIACEPYRGR